MGKQFGKVQKHLLIVALAGSVFLTGCSKAADRSASSKQHPQKGQDLAAIVQPFLPEGARLQKPEPLWESLYGDNGVPENNLAVQTADLTGDSKPEIIAGYRVSPGRVGVLVLQQDESWREIYRKEDCGYALDRLQAADITGDGRAELLVGGAIGASAGVGLEILTWDGQGLRKMAQTGYHRLEVKDLPGIYGPDGKQELITWSKDTGDAMAVEVYRWNGEKPVPAEDTYRAYFPKVVEYYQERVKKMPEAAFYWYYLADAQVKAGKFQDALASADKGLALKGDYPEADRYRLVRGQALLGLGRYQEAIKAFSDILEQWGNYSPSDKGTSWMAKTLARVFYHRGEAYLALGDEARARADWRQARDWDRDWDQPVRALQKLDLAAAQKMISDYLAGHPASGGPEFAERLMAWAQKETLPGGKRIDLYAIVPENSSNGDSPRVLLADWTVAGGNEPSYPKAHGVYWWAKGQLNAQVQLYSVDADLHGLGQDHRLLQARQAGGRMAAIYDSAAFGSGSPVPVLYLWELGNDSWKILWRSDADPAWRNSHGQIRFTGPGIEEFTLESDSWFAGDGKDTIFHEANPGPHRRFLDLWKLNGEIYELREKRTLPSAYNTLVEFVYALSTGQTANAAKLVTKHELVKQAVKLGLVQKPLGQKWMLSLNEPQSEQSGPLTILDGPAAGVKVTFVQHDGQWLINGIKR